MHNNSAPPPPPVRKSKPAVPPKTTPSDSQSSKSSFRMQSIHNGIAGPFRTTSGSHDVPAGTKKAACNESHKAIQCKTEMESPILVQLERCEQDEESTVKCPNLLKSLFKPVDDKLKASDYFASRGYQRYLDDRAELEKKYR